MHAPLRPSCAGFDPPARPKPLSPPSSPRATLTFPQTLVLRCGRFEPEERRSPQVVSDYAKWFLWRLRAVEQASAKALAAGRFTAADMVVGYAQRLAEKTALVPISDPTLPATGGACERATATEKPSPRKNPQPRGRR
jgi:hypothetical protein